MLPVVWRLSNVCHNFIFRDFATWTFHSSWIFPLQKQYIHIGSREGALKKAKEADEDKEMDQYWFDDDVGSNNSGYYELQAVLTHKGRSSNSGHYVAWTKYKGDTWIECNDDDVNPIHIEDVLKLSGGG